MNLVMQTGRVFCPYPRSTSIRVFRRHKLPPQTLFNSDAPLIDLPLFNPVFFGEFAGAQFFKQAREIGVWNNRLLRQWMASIAVAGLTPDRLQAHSATQSSPGFPM